MLQPIDAESPHMVLQTNADIKPDYKTMQAASSRITSQCRQHIAGLQPKETSMKQKYKLMQPLEVEYNPLTKRCEEGRRGRRLEEEDKRQRRVEKTIRGGGEEAAGSTSPLTKGKRGRERPLAPVH